METKENGGEEVREVEGGEVKAEEMEEEGNKS